MEEGTDHTAGEVTLVSVLGVLSTSEFYKSNWHLKLALKSAALHNDTNFCLLHWTTSRTKIIVQWHF